MARRTICLVKDCTSPVSCRQVCAAHYRQLKKIGQLPERLHAVKSVCGISGCEHPVIALGLCPAHYARMQRHGDPLGGPGRGSPGKARGARGTIVKDGKHENPEVFLQRGTDSLVVAAQMTEHGFGRPSLPGEFIRHIDGDTTNARSDNLELWLVEPPPREGLKGLLKWAQALNDRYLLAVQSENT